MRLFLFFTIVILFSSCKINKPGQLYVKKINNPSTLDFDSISASLEEVTEKIAIDKQNWTAFDYRPDVSFRIGHAENILFLKFYVSEQHVLAQYDKPNSPTHRDSCVEFFIDPDQSGAYYNFEINCIGTMHLAYGPDRHKRTFISKEMISDQVYTSSTLGKNTFEEKSGSIEWEMVVALPASIFIHHPDLNFNALHSKANFYKCGDDTNEPHYLSWNEISSPKPDFHRPEFFGSLLFD